MHPVLDHQTMHDLASRHVERVEGELRRRNTMTEGAGLPIARSASRPVGPTLRGAIAAVVALPKRLAWAHS